MAHLIVVPVACQEIHKIVLCIVRNLCTSRLSHAFLERGILILKEPRCPLFKKVYILKLSRPVCVQCHTGSRTPWIEMNILDWARRRRKKPVWFIYAGYQLDIRYKPICATTTFIIICINCKKPNFWPQKQYLQYFLFFLNVWFFSCSSRGLSGMTSFASWSGMP